MSAQRNLRGFIKADELSADHQTIEVSVKLPLGIVKSDPWLVDAPVGVKSRRDFSLSPCWGVHRGIAGRRCYADAAMPEVLREERAKLIQHMALAPRRADDDSHRFESTQECRQSRQEAQR